MSELVRPDVVPFLLTVAAARWQSYDVADVLPDGPDLEWERPVVLLYEQDAYRLSDVSWSVTVAYRVLAGTRALPDEARGIAFEVEAFLWGAAKLPGKHPVAAVLDSAGPNLVPDEHETAVLYGTVELVIAGVYRPAQTG